MSGCPSRPGPDPSISTSSGRGSSAWMRSPADRVGAGSAPEDLRDLVGRRFLELVVSTVGGLLVRAPPNERRAVSEPVALEMVVRHLDDPFGPERLPGQVLA